MELETLKALIPTIPGMLGAGLSVWNGVLKPLLLKIGYKITKELEQEILALEEKKDIEAFTDKIEKIYKEVSQTAIQQNPTGDRNIGIGGDNSGPIDNSTHSNTTNVYLASSEEIPSVKKN